MFFVISQTLAFETSTAGSVEYTLFTVLLIILFCIALVLYIVSVIKRFSARSLRRKETRDLDKAVDLNKTFYLDRTGTQVDLHLSENPTHRTCIESYKEGRPVSPSQAVKDMLEMGV
jgi:hypothetical protein